MADLSIDVLWQRAVTGRAIATTRIQRKHRMAHFMVGETGSLGTPAWILRQPTIPRCRRALTRYHGQTHSVMRQGSQTTDSWVYAMGDGVGRLSQRERKKLRRGEAAEACLLRLDYGLRSAADAQLGIDARDVVAHGFRSNEEPLGNLSIVSALGNQL